MFAYPIATISPESNIRKDNGETADFHANANL